MARVDDLDADHIGIDHIEQGETMKGRTILMAATAAVLPLGLIAVAGGSASASPVPKAKGTVTCAVAGNATFTPPLTPNGTAHIAHEVIQFNLSATGCSGPSANTPVISPTSATIVTKAIKYKDARVGKTRVAGACANGITFNPTLLLRSTISWAPVNVKHSTVKLGPLSGVSMANPMESGFTGSGTGSQSYAGGASVSLFLQPASLTAIENTCKDGDAGTSVSEMDFDSTTSSITVGTSLTKA
jgi:hypothetical protein